MLEILKKNRVLPPISTQSRSTLLQVHEGLERATAGFRHLVSSGLTRSEIALCVLFWVLVPGATACLSFYFTWRLGLKGGLERAEAHVRYSKATIPK